MEEPEVVTVWRWTIRISKDLGPSKRQEVVVFLEKENGNWVYVTQQLTRDLECH